MIRYNAYSPPPTHTLPPPTLNSAIFQPLVSPHSLTIVTLTQTGRQSSPQRCFTPSTLTATQLSTLTSQRTIFSFGFCSSAFSRSDTHLRSPHSAVIPLTLHQTHHTSSTLQHDGLKTLERSTFFGFLPVGSKIVQNDRKKKENKKRKN
jgi:hypothetical protein